MATFVDGIIFVGHHCPKCGISFGKENNDGGSHYPLENGGGYGVMANAKGFAVVPSSFDPSEPMFPQGAHYSFPIHCNNCGEVIYMENGGPNPDYLTKLVVEYAKTTGLEAELSPSVPEAEELHYLNRELELPSVCPECCLSFEESWNHSVPGEITHENYPLNAGSWGGMVYEGLLVVPYGYEGLDNDDNLANGPFGYPVSCSSCGTVLYNEEGKYVGGVPGTANLKPQLDTMIPTKPVEEQ